MSQVESRIKSYKADARKITVVFVTICIAWILLSDEFAARFASSNTRLLRLSEYKGVLFVIVVSWILYVMLTRSMASIARSQQELAESQRRFAAFMTHLPVGAFLKTANQQYVYANEFWERAFSRGKPWLDAHPLDLFPRELAEKFMADDRTVLAHGGVIEATFKLEDEKGDERLWLIHRFPVPAPTGSETLIGGFAIEITGQRRLEEQMQQMAKLEAVGLLAGGIAHDFNNLLTVINGYSELLSRKTSNTEHAVREIRKAGERASQLTRQLLAFGRKQVLKPEVVDIAEVVAGMESILQRLVGDLVRMHFQFEPDVAPVLADPSQLEQVLMNLCMNAGDAMPGGGNITIHAGNTDWHGDERVLRAGLAQGRYVSISVQDTGTGMSPETQARIFEPFFSTKEKGKGTGLGLAAVYGIVRQSGGAVIVESALGEGSTFHIYWPAAETRAEPINQISSTIHGGSESVLLVEDEESVRHVLKEMLARSGYRVVAAESLETAIAESRGTTERIDLVICDVVLPDCTGPELVRQLRTERQGFKVIFITGYSEDAVAQHGALEFGARLLQKPFDAATFTSEVRAALDGVPDD